MTRGKAVNNAQPWRKGKSVRVVNQAMGKASAIEAQVTETARIRLFHKISRLLARKTKSHAVFPPKARKPK
jgi:hypothetical protein